MKLKYWIISARLKLLILGVGPVLVGISLALSKGYVFNGLLNSIILFCVIGIQIATHFFNDALDFMKGADTADRKGPQRAVQKKIITPKELIRAAFFCLFLATLGGVYLVIQSPFPILYIGSISLALAYFYTGGKYSLAYTGWADFFVILFFGIIPVSTVFYLNTGYWDGFCVGIGFQYGLLALNFLIINNLRDFKEDLIAHKKTLVVRWGRCFGIKQWIVAHYVPYIIGIYFFIIKSNFIILLPCLLLPFSVYIHVVLNRIYKENLLYTKVFSLIFWYYILFVFLSFFMCLFL